jgi:hypothetical protein
MEEVPLGEITLNWKVSGPGLESVAVTVHTTCFPKGCGAGSDDVKDVNVIVAWSGICTAAAATRRKAKYAGFITLAS